MSHYDGAILLAATDANTEWHEDWSITKTRAEYILDAVAPAIAARALREAVEADALTIPDALGYKVRAVFVESLLDRADEIERGAK